MTASTGPQVDFHSGMTDKLGHACRLVRKAWRAGHRVLVVGHPRTLARLDPMLWTFDPDEFLPHARWGPQAAAPVRRSRVWLSEQWVSDLPGDGPLAAVFMDADGPPSAPSAARVFELVSSDPADVGRGRERWKAWRAQGVKPTNHDQSGAGGR